MEAFCDTMVLNLLSFERMLLMVFAFRIFLLFIIYSFMAWVYEVVICSVEEKKIVNRGFLYGPICPVYGVGALLIVSLLGGLKNNIVVLFVGSVILATVLEYLTAVLLENVFGAKLWSYSNYPLNFKGRVSLFSSLVFGTMALLLTLYIHPFTNSLLNFIPDKLIIIAGSVFFVAFVFDVIISVRQLIVFNIVLKKIKHTLEFYAEQSKQLKDIMNEKIESSKNYIKNMPHIQLMDLKKLNFERLITAFPNMMSVKYTEEFHKLKEYTTSRTEAIASTLKGHKK